MSPDKIKERSDFLIQFLDLPNKWRLVVNLSGGQQRSVLIEADIYCKYHVNNSGNLQIKNQYKDGINIDMNPSEITLLSITKI